MKLTFVRPTTATCNASSPFSVAICPRYSSNAFDPIASSTDSFSLPLNFGSAIGCLGRNADAERKRNVGCWVRRCFDQEVRDSRGTRSEEILIKKTTGYERERDAYQFC